MGANGLDEYWVAEHVKEYLRKLGFVLPLDDMEPWIRSWDDWMSARGEFSSTNFMNAAQATVVRAFGLGTGAWAL